MFVFLGWCDPSEVSTTVRDLKDITKILRGEKDLKIYQFLFSSQLNESYDISRIRPTLA